jgi:hypothetical protein
LLVNKLLLTALILPQVINGPLPILVGACRAGTGPMKNGPPKQGLRQQASGLVVFAEGALEPFLIVKGAAIASRGVVAFVVIEHPFGGAWGRLRPFVLQPPCRIGEGGRGQMGWR